MDSVWCNVAISFLFVLANGEVMSESRCYSDFDYKDKLLGKVIEMDMKITEQMKKFEERTTLLEAELSELTEKCKRNEHGIENLSTILKEQLMNVLRSEIREQVQSFEQQLNLTLASIIDSGTTVSPTVTPVVNTGKTPTCPASYSWYEPLNLCYKVSAIQQIWQSAMDTCVSEGGHLMDLKTSDIHEYIKGKLSGGVYFVGATDVMVEGNWVWTDGSPLNYTAWYDYQPNNYNGNQDCMALHSSYLYNFGDFSCTDSRYYICQIDITQ